MARVLLLYAAAATSASRPAAAPKGPGPRLAAEEPQKSERFKKQSGQPKPEKKKVPGGALRRGHAPAYMFTLRPDQEDAGRCERTNILGGCVFVLLSLGLQIGVVGQNGAGTHVAEDRPASTTPSTGAARTRTGRWPSAGYLAQEPTLEGETVDDAIAPAIAKSRAVLDKFTICPPHWEI